MSMPEEHDKNDIAYVIDVESVAETARLINLDRLMTRSMGGIFPEGSDPSAMHYVLDIACGPGGWVQDVAYAHPKIQVVGIDISQQTVQYALARAKVQGLDNANVQVMDALQPFDFPDNSFDFVNARFLFGFMPSDGWPGLVQECVRVTRPGGSIRLTELEPPVTNSPALERLWVIFTHAFQIAKRSFSPTGHNLGITAMLEHFLRNAHCQNIQSKAHVINYSAESEFHEVMRQNDMVTLRLLEPFFIKSGLITREEFENLYQQMMTEMLSDDFCAIWFLLSSWGQKSPLE